VLQLAGVKDASLAESLPTLNYQNSTTVFKEKVLDQKKSVGTQYWGVDEDYIPVLGIKMAAGRNFSREMKGDTTGLIINEAAEKLLGFSNPLNQMLYV